MLASFTIGGATSQAKALLMKNPWGVTYYSGKWNYNDPDWNTVDLSTVPFGIDPRTSHLIGIFVVPVTAVAQYDVTSSVTTGCFDAFYVAHIRDSENYQDTWYDAIGMDETQVHYVFTPP